MEGGSRLGLVRLSKEICAVQARVEEGGEVDDARKIETSAIAYDLRAQM